MDRSDVSEHSIPSWELDLRILEPLHLHLLKFPWLCQPVRSLYRVNSHVYVLHPIHSHTHVYLQCIHALYTDNPCTTPENRVFCESENFLVNPSCYLRRSPLQMYHVALHFPYFRASSFKIIFLQSTLTLGGFYKTYEGFSNFI
jgi:hypothetical protein